MKIYLSILALMIFACAGFAQEQIIGVTTETNYASTTLTAGGDYQLNANGQEFDPSGAASFVSTNLGNGGVATMLNPANTFYGTFNGNATTASFATNSPLGAFGSAATNSASAFDVSGAANAIGTTTPANFTNAANTFFGANLNVGGLTVTNYVTQNTNTIVGQGYNAYGYLMNTYPYTNKFNNSYVSIYGSNYYLTNNGSYYVSIWNGGVGATNLTGFVSTNWYSGSTPLVFSAYTAYYYPLVTNTVTTINGGGSLSNKLAVMSFTFPATTATWTNPVSSSITVFIDNSGVTLSAVKLNGTTIFSLANDLTLTLQPNEYFSETYTVGTPVGHWKPLP
jgi:hypothetical protein